MKKKDIQPPLRIDSVLKKCRRQLNHVRLSVSHEHHLKQKREEWRHIVVFGCECGYEHEVVILGEKPAAPVPEPDWEGIAASAAENRAAPAAPNAPGGSPKPETSSGSPERAGGDGKAAADVCECGHHKSDHTIEKCVACSSFHEFKAKGGE